MTRVIVGLLVGVAMAGVGAGCSVDRAKLPVVREMENVATVEFQSVWAAQRFEVASAGVRVAVVTREKGRRVRLGEWDALAALAADRVGPAGEVRVGAVRGETVVTAVRPAVAVEMSADRARVLPGDLVVFTIVVTNTGPLEVEGVEVRDVLPEGLEVAGARGKGGEVKRVGRREVRVGYPGVMGVGGVRRVEVEARVR